MRDISVMCQSVVDTAVKPLVEESIRAFNGGAHRAATVSLWVAVAVDLTNKVRALAEGGDGAANSRVQKLDAAVISHSVKDFLAFETGLIDLARDLELLDRQEAVHLQRLYEDRNLCAHPGFAAEGVIFAPTAEAVRAHLVAAHDATFSKGAVAGKRRQAMLVGEIQGDAWPNPSSLSAYLSSRFFDGAAETTKSNMMKLLIKTSIIPPLDLARPNRVARRAREACAARRERDPAAFANAVAAVLSSYESSEKLTNQALVRAVGAFGWVTEFWEALPGTALERARSYISSADCGELVEHRFFGSRRPLDEKLSQEFDEALASLNCDELAAALRQTRERGQFIPRVLELIGASEDFATAATRIQLLAEVSPQLSSGDIALLQQKILNNPGDQIRPARDVEEALISAFERACPTKPDVVDAWRALAATLAKTTNPSRYFGNRQGPPYAELQTLVDK